MDVFENRIVPGVINPIRRVTEFKHVHLNSAFRENYYATSSTDFIYVFPYDIKHVVSIRLEAIDIPNCWYLLSHKKGNNRFIIQTNNGATVTIEDIVVPDGTYDATTLVNYMNQTYFYQSGTTTDLQYIKVSINPVNLKTIFEIVGGPPSGFNFDLHFVEEETTNMMETLGWVLGYRVARYNGVTDAIQSEGLFDAGGDRYIYFCLDDFNRNVSESQVVCFDGSTLNKDVLAKIYLTNGKFQLNIMSDEDGCCSSRSRNYYGPVNVKRVRIRLLDQYGEAIDLNYMDYGFTLLFEILYDGGNARRD